MPLPPYYPAPPTWTFTDPNPFTPDGSYGSAWSAFCLLDSADDQYATGQSGQGPFSVRFGRYVPHLEHRLADFLSYEHTQGRQVILDFPPEIDLESYVAQALTSTPRPNIIRPEDQPILVHSTNLAAWQAIQCDGAVKAASQLTGAICPHAPGNGPLKEYLRHEPPEYRDYIMLGDIESCGPEMVVASFQDNRFVMDEQATYRPGVRLYFDSHHLIRDGLGVRDGLHLLKVYQRLPLEPYLLGAISALDLHPEGEPAYWTLRAFVDQTNAALHERIKKGSADQTADPRDH